MDIKIKIFCAALFLASHFWKVYAEFEKTHLQEESQTHLYEKCERLIEKKKKTAK